MQNVKGGISVANNRFRLMISLPKQRIILTLFRKLINGFPPARE